MSLIRLEGGASPPFGAIVLNQQRQEAGIVGDDGSVYLTGLRPGQNMTLHWDGEKQCDVKLPEVLTDLNESILTLLCTRMGS
jgi:outer membrane usher protein FimD/PapC